MTSHDRASLEVEAHDLGLSHDLPRIIERQRLGRRRALRLFGGVGVVAAGGVLTACTDETAGGPAGGPPEGGESDVDVAEGEIPEETAGPFPGDGLTA